MIIISVLIDILKAIIVKFRTISFSFINLLEVLNQSIGSCIRKCWEITKRKLLILQFYILSFQLVTIRAAV